MLNWDSLASDYALAIIRLKDLIRIYVAVCVAVLLIDVSQEYDMLVWLIGCMTVCEFSCS